MSAGGYIGMLATLAFVLGLVMLVARLAKRFLPGAVSATGTGTFAVVQRIPLGQRQGIAIVQRGDLLIGVSVGEGGVRTLFTMPVGMPGDVVSSMDVHDDEITVPVTMSAHELASGSMMRMYRPQAAAGVHEHTHEAYDVAAPPTFRKALGIAIRNRVLRALILTVGALSAHVLQAQGTPAQQTPRVTPPVAQSITQPVTQPITRPATRPTAAGTTQQPGLRTLPAPAAQPGPRDLPKRVDPQVPSPRPAKPAVTNSRTGGEATIAPLLPAPQARDIAALQARATGNGALTTPEAQRIAGRADSILSKIAPQMELKLNQNAQGEGLKLSGSVGVVILMGLLSMLPMLLLMMTGFTRILVTLHFLKQALGTQSAPPGQLLAAMALLLSGFVMGPTLKEVNTTALEPWMAGQIEQVEMMSRAVVPFKAFMLRQVRDQDLQTFVDLAEIKQPESREAVPLTILMSAFVTSELRTAFQIGFALFLPFIVIDVVVGSVLMSMGMVMLPPAMISMPFKLLLFVLVDGWGLVVTGLVQSFR